MIGSGLTFAVLLATWSMFASIANACAKEADRLPMDHYGRAVLAIGAACSALLAAVLAVADVVAALVFAFDIWGHM